MNAIDRSPFHFEVEDVYLSSGFSGKIVSCTEGGKGALAANVDRASTWETIVPEPQADGTVAFRSKVSNLYISVVDGTDRLVPSVSGNTALGQSGGAAQRAGRRFHRSRSGAGIGRPHS